MWGKSSFDSRKCIGVSLECYEKIGAFNNGYERKSLQRAEGIKELVRRGGGRKPPFYKLLKKKAIRVSISPKETLGDRSTSDMRTAWDGTTY